MVTIRPALPADAAGMADVHVATWRTTYPGLLPDRYLVALDPKAYAAHWRRALADPQRGRGCHVAVDEGGGVLGFGWCGRQRSRVDGYQAEFYALYVVDHAQGQGIGRRLMGVMAEDLVGRGHRSALVWVLQRNPSRFFYERMGGLHCAEHPISFAGKAMTEIAYGWPDLMSLGRLSAGPRVG